MLHTALFLLLASVTPLSAGQQATTGTAVHHRHARAHAAKTQPADAAQTQQAQAKPQAPAQPEIQVSTAAIAKLVEAAPAVRGIHLTSWGAGAARSRREIIHKISGTVINTVVVAVKETDGKVYIPGVEKAARFGTYEAAIPEPEAMLKDFKDAKLYTVARIVVFKDKVLPKARKDLAVHTPDGGIWRSHNGATWADEYNREVWEYIGDIAERCAKLGFDEIQFDYIRYPSEGNTSLCRYSKPHSRQTAVANLKDFLDYQRKRLAPYKVKMSADVFGLTTTVKDDMGIGQDIKTLASGADYVYPMMYPSHYYPGEYGLKNPNKEPFKVINRGLHDAMGKLGDDYVKMRPYLQDFSLFGVHYGPNELHAQLMAEHKNLLRSWVLWNPGNKYTWSALTPATYRSHVDPDFK